MEIVSMIRALFASRKDVALQRCVTYRAKYRAAIADGGGKKKSEIFRRLRSGPVSRHQTSKRGFAS